METADRAGVVLAGGTSERFERGEKALATLDGVPFVTQVAERLGEAADGTVVVSVRTESQERSVERALADGDVPATLVRDAPSLEGPLAGVRAALDAVDAPSFALVACDMPLFDPAVVAWLAGHAGGVDAVVPVADRAQPLQALYRTAAVERALADLPATGGAFALLDALDSVATVPVADAPASLDAERSLTNVNTVGDLSEIRTDEA